MLLTKAGSSGSGLFTNAEKTMSVTANMPRELHGICSEWSKEMERIKGAALRLQFMQARFPELLKNTALFTELIGRIARGGTYPDIRRTDAFDNEILLYLNPKRIFSIRMFLFGPEDFTPVHDHNAWAITGSVINKVTIVRYCRDDDGSVEGAARIHETGRKTISPGEIETTLPLNEGIHKTGNTSRDPMVMVSAYGSPIRRLYVNGYDVEKNRVYRMYPPRMKKKLLARQTLNAMG